MKPSPYDHRIRLFVGQHVEVEAVKACPEAEPHYELTNPLTGKIEPFVFPFDANMRASMLELEAFDAAQRPTLFDQLEEKDAKPKTKSKPQGSHG